MCGTRSRIATATIGDADKQPYHTQRRYPTAAEEAKRRRQKRQRRRRFKWDLIRAKRLMRLVCSRSDRSVRSSRNGLVRLACRSRLRGAYNSQRMLSGAKIRPLGQRSSSAFVLYLRCPARILASGGDAKGCRRGRQGSRLPRPVTVGYTGETEAGEMPAPMPVKGRRW